VASPKRAKLPGGAGLELDGDLVYLIDLLYREIALKGEFTHTYEQVKKAIESVWKQMDERTRKEYFLSSVFLNYATYETEMLDRAASTIVRRAKRK